MAGPAFALAGPAGGPRRGSPRDDPLLRSPCFDESCIRQQDAHYVFSYTAGHAGLGSSLVFSYLVDNTDKIFTRLQGKITSVFNSSVRFMSTEQDIAEIEGWYALLSTELKDILRVPVNSAKTNIRSRVAFRGNYEDELLDILK